MGSDEQTFKWKRYRFKTRSIEDYRPLIFNPKYPWWCSGEGWESQKLVDGEWEMEHEYATIIVYLPVEEDLIKYWDDAYEVEFTLEEEIKFSGRFPKPEYYVDEI